MCTLYVLSDLEVGTQTDRHKRTEISRQMDRKAIIGNRKLLYLETEKQTDL